MPETKEMVETRIAMGKIIKALTACDNLSEDSVLAGLSLAVSNHMKNCINSDIESFIGSLRLADKLTR